MESIGETAVIGKPAYDREALRQLTVRDIELRLDRIDNVIAKEVASELWAILFHEGVIAHSVIGRIVAELGVTRIAGHGMELLILIVNRLRRIQFSEFLLLDKVLLKEKLSNMHWSWHSFDFLPSKLDRQGRVRFLTGYMECLLPDGWNVPWERARLAYEIANPIIAIAAIFFMISQQNVLPVRIYLPITLLLMLAYPTQTWLINMYRKLRLLALYISFTDEFAQSGEAGEEPIRFNSVVT